MDQQGGFITFTVSNIECELDFCILFALLFFHAFHQKKSSSALLYLLFSTFDIMFQSMLFFCQTFVFDF